MILSIHLKLKISSNELQLLPQLQKLLNAYIGHTLVIDLNLYVAFLLELLEVFKLSHAELDQGIVFVERFEGLDIGFLIGSERVRRIAEGQSEVVVGLANDWSN